MVRKAVSSAVILGLMAPLALAVPLTSPAQAQRWGDQRPAPNGGPDWDRSNSDRHPDWNRPAPNRDDWARREWQRKRRKDAKTDGIVVGVVGTAVVAGIIAAATSGKKDRRAEYCRDRYGNYDRDSDSYRASDGRIYRCE